MAMMRAYREACTTEGERKVFDFLKDNFSDEYIVWSNVFLIDDGKRGIKEAEVDFIVHHSDLGIIMFEVKDWRATQVKSIARDDIYIGTNRARYPNPYFLMRNKSYTLRSRMEGYKQLKTKEGRIKAPINFALVFPYITRQEWENTLTLLDVIDPASCGMPSRKILFSENLHSGSLNQSNDHYHNIMKKTRSVGFTFPSSLESQDLDLLDELFGKPEGKQALYKGLSETKQILADKKLVILDEQQKEKADQFLEMVNTAPGHLIIKGIAGGGKTVVLLRLFSLVARDPFAKIAYIGRQRELVASFKDNLVDLGIDPDSPYYTVETFHEFFYRYFSMENHPDMGRSGNGYPNDEELKDFISRHLHEIEEEYDFMFIDEGHNLPDEWVKMLVLKTRGKKDGNLVYVEDFEQNIYGIKRDFDNAFLTNRQEELIVNYRNTIEIQKVALMLTDKDRNIAIVDDKKHIRRGHIPEVIYGDDREKIAHNVATRVETWIKKDKVPVRDIAIIYASSEGGKDALVSNIVRAFKAKNMQLLSHYVDDKERSILDKFPENEGTILPSRKDGRRVENPELSANFITAFSSQGMSYRCVAVLMDNFDMEKKWNKKLSKNLKYIALTRATHELVLVFGSCDTNCSKAIALTDQIKNRGS